MKIFEVGLYGLAKISSGADHTWCVMGNGTCVVDLTWAQATELARDLNERWIRERAAQVKDWDEKFPGWPDNFRGDNTP